ncbi:MAG: putative metalloprotease [Gammaproteobacteria bacterium]|jgi:predicted metalloprotease
MGRPKRNRHWLRAIQRAYERAQNAVARGEIAKLDIHRLAPRLAAKERRFNDSNEIETMIDATVTAVEEEARIDEEARGKIKFHFVSAYVFAHVHMEHLEELEADRLMDYLNESWDLFDENELAI